MSPSVGPDDRGRVQDPGEGASAVGTGAEADRTKPITLVGGYLGSGKTTLINRFLSSPRAGRTAVVVNDFGDVNIDAALIRASGADTLELTNGCICCQITDDVQRTMSGLAARADIDRVICEVSGIGDPSQLGTWQTFPGFRAGPTVVCADAMATEARLADEYVADVVRAQIAGADIVLVTKADLATADQVERVRARCAEIAPHARVEVLRGAGELGEESRVDVAEVLADLGVGGLPHAPSVPPAADSPTQTAHHAPGHADVHRTATVQLPADAHVDGVVRVLGEHAAALVRAKGFVRDDRGRWYEVQLAGGVVTAQPLPEGGAAPSQAELVLIAAGPDADRALSRAATELSR